LLTQEPRTLIKSLPGIKFVELPESDWCCGGAGTYNLTHPDISIKILGRKMENLKKTNADYLVTSCPACIIQLAYGVRKWNLPTKVLHISQLACKQEKTE
jgi:glycolate oxidase iron-sulfur subunit